MGLSQQGAASALGMSSRSIRNFENGFVRVGRVTRLAMSALQNGLGEWKNDDN